MIFKDLIIKEPSSRIKNNHSSDLIIGNATESVITRQRYINLVIYVSFTSMIEPENAEEDLSNEFWIRAMEEELE